MLIGLVGICINGGFGKEEKNIWLPIVERKDGGEMFLIILGFQAQLCSKRQNLQYGDEVSWENFETSRVSIWICSKIVHGQEKA